MKVARKDAQMPRDGDLSGARRDRLIVFYRKEAGYSIFSIHN